jgi:hypothetical protein
MSVRKFLGGVALFAAVLMVANPAQSQDKKDDKAKLFEEYMKLAQPGPEHKRLNALDGSWDCAVKIWMDPKAPPTESKGTIERKWIMGGRYLEERIKGEAFGMAFEGYGLTGYDNLRKKYTSAWIDNMGTGIMTSLGDYDADKKAFTFVSEEIDPLTRKPKKMKSVLRIIDDNKQVLESYEPGPDGKEWRMFELIAVRKGKK